MTELLNQMTLEEKAALVSGTDFMYTNPVPRLGIPSLRMSDGPHGLRIQSGSQDNGVAKSEQATSFPTAVSTASSWNPENTYKMGVAMGEEANDYGVHIVLGPGANIKRNPLCGRNFEYFSEDPFLAGEMGAAEVNGIQSQGVGVSVKHYALNNSENYRFNGNSIADERAIREIYLKQYERIVKKSKPTTLMCSYNQINGTFSSENKWLLTDILRDEWGFDGVVMTDWGAIRDRVLAIKAGLDIEMPGDTAYCRRAIIDGVKNGSLEEKELDKCVLNILKLIEKVSCTKKGDKADYSRHHVLAADIAEDCAVLMKNDGALPVNMNERILIVGDMFEKMRYQGAGSSMINPAMLTTPKQAFDSNRVDYDFARGYRSNTSQTDEQLIKEATEKTQSCDKILVFCGLTDDSESEGGDRTTMALPENQQSLINALCETGKKIILVLFGGSPVEIPFKDKVSAILNMFLPGQNGGTAAYNLLYGKKSPSGRLSETWPESYSDVPFADEFSKTVNEKYKESIFVGYRYYLTAKKKVAFPFGFGLSYTRFAYSDIKAEDMGDTVKVTCRVTNEGDTDGAEVVQVYVKAPDTKVFKAETELKGFQKLYISKGESRTAEITIEKSELGYYNTKLGRWVLENGEYEFRVCTDCETVKGAEKIILQGETVECPYEDAVNEIYKKADMKNVTDEVFEKILGSEIPPLPSSKPITIETLIGEFKNSKLLGRLIYKALTGVGYSQIKKGEKMPEGTERENMIKGGQFLVKIMTTNSCRSLSMSSSGQFGYNMAEAFVEFANGHFFKGMKHICSPIKVPKLPKEEVKKK